MHPPIHWARARPRFGVPPRLALSAAETRNAANRAFEGIQKATDHLDDVLSRKCTAAEKRDALRSLRAAVSNAPANVKFAADSLSEHAENVVTKAKADIEATIDHRARQLGIDPAGLQFRAIEGHGPAEDLPMIDAAPAEESTR